MINTFPSIKKINYILLPIVKIEEKLLCASEHRTFPGLHLQVESSVEVEDKLLCLYRSKLTDSSQDSDFKIEKNFREKFLIDGVEFILIFGFVKSNSTFTPDIKLISFPDLLRGMPKTKTRIVYLKILQVICGVHKETLEAYEIKRK